MPSLTPHRLDPLLKPRSLALVGASGRPDSAGLAMVEMARLDGYAGRVYPVNPAYGQVAGLRCFPSLEALPEPVEHVVLGVANARLEAALDEAIAHGARAATIFASCRMDEDRGPSLAERLAERASAAGLTLCGGSSMGFYNRAIGLRIASFPSPPDLTSGGIVWVSQSGSVFSALAHNDRRLGFALAVSSGMEMTTTVGDYIDWALHQPETKVIGLFLEGVREPHRFRAALEAAAEREIPVVALKVGRSQRSAAMAATHTGALAGNDSSWRALFRRFGVCTVDDLDEMAASLQLFELQRELGSGGLATIHDSGGERELLVDMAERMQVPFANINQQTKAELAKWLEPGHLPENPLDAWGTAQDYVVRSANCLMALMQDQDTALAIAFSDPRDGYWYSQGVAESVLAAARSGSKPVALASNTALAVNGNMAMRLREAGVPLIIGTRAALAAAKNALAYRDFRAERLRRGAMPDAPPATVREVWRTRLDRAAPLLEAEGLGLLASYGIDTVRRGCAGTLEEAIRAAEVIGYPVALKTAEGHAHKSELRGVVLGIADSASLSRDYAELAGRLGPRVLVEEMVPPGVEIALGAIDDADFGPVVMIAAGGTLMELIGDSIVSLAPFDETEAYALLSQLKVARLLRGWRGAPPIDRIGLSRTIAKFSRLAADLAGSYAQIDVNSLIAGSDRVVAVDALVIPP